jgi:hypothetical protein
LGREGAGKPSQRPTLSLAPPTNCVPKITQKKRLSNSKNDNQEIEPKAFHTLHDAYPTARQLWGVNSSFHESSKHLEELKLTLGRDPDIMDFDESVWQTVSELGKIVTMNSLGEGASGAVIKCVLEGASTVFALKVCQMLSAPLQNCFIQSIILNTHH